MTLRELSQLYYLNREIEHEKKRLKELEAAATDTSAKITGLPHVGGIADKTAIAAQMAECRVILEARIAQSAVEYNRLMCYINGIPDPLTRQIFTLRFVNGLSWNQVALRVGGGNTGDGVRKHAMRFLHKN